MASRVPTPEQLQALPPGYMAEDVGYRLTNTVIALLVLVHVVYISNIVSRVACAERNHWEIWTLYPLSYLSIVGLCITCILMVKIGGVGRHMSYLLANEPTKIVPNFKLQTASELLYIAGITFPKVCILLLYTHIFIDRKVRIVTWAVMAIVVGNFVCTGLITYFVICQPFAFRWDKTIPGGHCADMMALYIWNGVPNMVSDVAIAILPISTIWKLQMNKKRKLGLFATFIAGSLGVVAAIFRFVEFYKIPLMTDQTYFASDLMSFTVIEPSAYFICSCLPGTRPLVRYIYRNYSFATSFSWTSGNRGSASRSSNSQSIALGNLEGNHTVFVYAPKADGTCSGRESSRTGLIRLEETVDVQSTPRRDKRGDMV